MLNTVVQILRFKTEGSYNSRRNSFCSSVLSFQNPPLLGVDGQRNNLSVEMPHNFFSFIDL